MLTNLLDISTCTPISQLPSIVNHNNQVITDEFNNIYNYEQNYIKSSVYTPVGSVKAYNAEFTTLTLDHLIIRDPNALSDIVKSTIKITDHNLLQDRYSNSDIEQAISINKLSSKYHFCHDASTIILPNFQNKVKGVLSLNDSYLTVYNVLEQIVYEIKDLKNRVYNNNTTANLAALNETVSTLSANAGISTYSASGVDTGINSVGDEPFAYPYTYLSMSSAQLRRLNVPKLHIVDLLAKKHYTYQNVNNPNITLNNTHYNALECTQPGIVINISLKITDTGNTKFYILLNRKNNKYLTIETTRPELTRIQLICTDAYNNTDGTIWDLYNYSLPNNNTSKIDIITA